jgi:hypothetical protein
MRNFESWETQDLEIEFGLEINMKSPLLAQWLSATSTFKDYEIEQIEQLKQRIFEFADYWNEDELKMQGIAKMIDFANYYGSDLYNVFSQRQISATINGIELGGRVDFVLAKGKQKPMKPYFFIHEYKQETKKGSSDPKGQLLSEMLVAQAKNDNNMPIYGCYVLGRSWFFVVLDGSEYAVSRAYDASQDDIYAILSILKKMKEKIKDNTRIFEKNKI